MVQEEELQAAQSAARTAPYSVHAVAAAQRVEESREEVSNVPAPRTFSRAAARPAPEPEPLPPPPPVMKVENNHTIEMARTGTQLVKVLDSLQSNSRPFEPKNGCGPSKSPMKLRCVVNPRATAQVMR